VLQANPGSFDPGRFGEVECAGVAGELHVCLTVWGNDSNVRHTIRAADESWPFPFGDVRAATAGVLPVRSLFDSLGAGEAGGNLHVCAAVLRRTESFQSVVVQPYHTIRSSSPPWTWTVFRQIPATVGLPAAATLIDIDCAGADGQLHVCCIAQNDYRGPPIPRRLWHTLRAVTEAWPFPFGDVRATVLRENPGSSAPGNSFGFVSCAVVAGALHVFAQAEGEVWHTVRRSGGGWAPFVNARAAILGAFPNSPNPGLFTDVSCSRVDANLHVCFLDGNGALWHTECNADRTWLFPFGDVVATVLRENPGSSDPRPIGSVATAGV
jgi:hypothetical protein